MTRVTRGAMPGGPRDGAVLRRFRLWTEVDAERRKAINLLQSQTSALTHLGGHEVHFPIPIGR